MKINDLNRRNFITKATALLTFVTGAASASGTSNTLIDNQATSDPDSTWKKINGTIYGAKADSRGPIGGGKGYGATITKGDYEVKSLGELIDALSKVKSGQVIFIPEELEIDLTARIYIEELVLVVPPGVTVAGNRGSNGSLGALLTSDALKTPVIFQIGGPGVRITGLRIQGPNQKRYVEHHTRSFGKDGLGKSYYYKFPVSSCIQTDFEQLEVDNCDISGFTRAIMLAQGDKHHIHHNFIHKCQYKGLGYGVSLAVASALIEYNFFDSNRHSLAGTGSPGCSYTARHNIELGTSLSHCFDMHGGRDRNDGTTTAGSTIEIYNNTFLSTEKAVGIRGVPNDKCVVSKNWFFHHPDAKKALFAEDKTTVFDNIYGEHPTNPN